jgi:hypothetical protein
MSKEWFIVDFTYIVIVDTNLTAHNKSENVPIYFKVELHIDENMWSKVLPFLVFFTSIIPNIKTQQILLACTLLKR